MRAIRSYSVLTHCVAVLGKDALRLEPTRHLPKEARHVGIAGLNRVGRPAIN